MVITSWGGELTRIITIYTFVSIEGTMVWLDDVPLLDTLLTAMNPLEAVSGLDVRLNSGP
jgi:hypothetical protein